MELYRQGSSSAFAAAAAALRLKNGSEPDVLEVFSFFCGPVRCITLLSYCQTNGNKLPKGVLQPYVQKIKCHNVPAYRTAAGRSAGLGISGEPGEELDSNQSGEPVSACFP
ncbi:hypothetical protein D3C81_1815210 [compost metagenome]